MKPHALLIAVGLASSTALAQMQAPVPSQPDSNESPYGSSASEPVGGSGSSGAQFDSQSGTPSSPSSGMSGTQSSTQPKASQPSAAGKSPEKEAMIARLQPKTVDGASYICGGVGKEEVRYMKRQANKHDLALEFATRRGEFLSDVNVQIADAQGKPVLQTNCDGPMMLVDLPRSGTYRIHADAAGYTQSHTVNVTHGQKGQQVASVVLAWPERVARAPSSAETQTGGSQTRGSGASGEDKRHGNW